MKELLTLAVAAAVSATAMAGPVGQAMLGDDLGVEASDFGQLVEQLARAKSLALFGTFGTLGASSTVSLTGRSGERESAAAHHGRVGIERAGRQR